MPDGQITDCAVRPATRKIQVPYCSLRRVGNSIFLTGRSRRTTSAVRAKADITARHRVTRYSIRPRVTVEPYFRIGAAN